MLKSFMFAVVVTSTVLAAAAPATAETLEFTDSIALSITNWDDSFTVPRFDPTLGTLISVTFELGGHVEGSAKFENLDAAPATVTMDLAADVELFRPDLTSLVAVLPLADTSDNVDAFDGDIDFDGTSGRTYPALSADASDSFVTTAPADLALFTGIPDITLPCTADGVSTGSGAGNLILQFATSASATVKVIYEYTGSIPTEDTNWSAIKSEYR